MLFLDRYTNKCILKNGFKVFKVHYVYVTVKNEFLGIESSFGGYNVHNNINRFFF